MNVAETGVALVAPAAYLPAYLPARRTSRIEPMESF